MKTSPTDWRGILLAGGKGLRAQPLTLAIPKPLLFLAGQTLIEGLLDGFYRAGIERVVLSLCHMAKHIEGYLRFARPDLHLEFWCEPRALGTAGCLRQLCTDAAPLLVANADLRTNLDFGTLMRAHSQAENAITIAAVPYEHTVPYGMLEFSQKGELQEWKEKPAIQSWVSGGIYALTASVTQLISPEETLDMPALVARARTAGLRVGVYQHHGEWLDIGCLAAYEEAVVRMGGPAPILHAHP